MRKYVATIKEAGCKEFSVVWECPQTAYDALLEVRLSYNEKDFQHVEWIKIYNLEEEPSFSYIKGE